MDPVISEKNVILRLKLSKFVGSEDGVDEVILSRSNKTTIIELSQGKVVSSLHLQQRITIAHQLKVFYCYQPKHKHYLFINGTDLVVLRKLKNSLVLHKTYNNVMNFDIKDHLNLGRPQVVIHVSDDLQPVVTDFNTVNTLSKIEPKQVQAFAPLVQKSKLRIKNAEKVVAEKAKIISKLSASLAFNCDDETILTTADKLVYMRENIMDGDVGHPSKSKALSVGESWFKIYLNHWIIGFPVINVSKEDIFSLEMYVSHESLTVKKSSIFTQTASTSNMYRESQTLYTNQSGVFVAVMEEPHLIPRLFVLSCVCCFDCACDESAQCYLGKMEITTSDLVGDKYKLSSRNQSTEDLIAIQASSKMCQLEFQLLNVELSEFKNAVELLLGLNKINSRVLLASSPSGIQLCHLIEFDEYSDTLIVFVDTTNLFILLVHKLMDLFRGAVLFKHPNSNPKRAIAAITKEISFVKNLLVSELMETDEKCKLSVNIEDPSRDLMVLEIESAVEMNMLKIHSTL